MKILTVAISMSVLVLVLTIPANAVVLCAKQRSDGTFNSSVRIREACKSRETQLDPAGLDLQGAQGDQGPQGVQGDPGDDGSEGAPGSPGELQLVDANGQVLGLVQAVDNSNLTEYRVFIESVGRLLLLAPSRTSHSELAVRNVEPGSPITPRYSAAGCTGTAYAELPNGMDENHILVHASVSAGVVTNSRFFVAEAFVPSPVAYASYRHDDQCVDVPDVQTNGEIWELSEIPAPVTFPIERPLQLVPTQ
jgi:hypothetical protein